jgi:putative ABC transport system permease protein
LQDLILNEIRIPKGRVIPQLFLFDIQEEQLDSLQSLIRSRGQDLAQPSAMVRARLEKVNGKPFKRDEETTAKGRSATLEDRNRRQFRNRGFNLSYRDTLSDAESLVSGRLWSGPVKPGEIPEISMEKDFAKRLELKLGDTLLFDVQGVEVEGKVTSLRQVRWASFQPNFFVLFQPGALEDAPKTFLGTLKRMPEDQAEDIQNRVSEAFPNVTILNLKDVIGRTVETLGKLTWLVRFLSGFALLIGLAILWLVVDALVSENQRTILLLRALGEPRRKLARLFLVHYAGFCLAAGLTGYFLSLIAAYIINLVVWEVPWVPDASIFLVCAGASLAVGAACSVYAAYRGAGQPLRGLLALSRA